MFSSKTMPGFGKNEDCPSSHKLLEFETGEMARAEADGVRKHLRLCEFCAAETEFYSRYPQTELQAETFEATEIPAPLFELAEALLKNRHDSRSLNALLLETEEPVANPA